MVERRDPQHLSDDALVTRLDGLVGTYRQTTAELLAQIAEMGAPRQAKRCSVGCRLGRVDGAGHYRAIRVVRANGWWNDFWQERAQRAAA